MRKYLYERTSLLSMTVTLALILSGCAGSTATETVPPVTSESTDSAEVVDNSTSQPDAVADENILFQDDFTNPASGWLEEKFDNFFIGYHEPENYHVEVTSSNYKTTVTEPGNNSYGDVTVEAKTYTASSKTAETGDYIFGVVLRRSGDQYYAFTISQRTKHWYVLKSTPNALEVLAEGTDEGIHDADTEDVLQVDAKGSDFSFLINDLLVSQVTDADYTAGEVGFFVQTFDAAAAHIHFDELTIKKVEGTESSSPGSALYHDDFTNPISGWAEKKFDNFFIGYHEPEYYHVEISSPNYKTSVFEPDGRTYDDTSIEVKVFTASSKTSETGDYIYGPAFRRSGDLYYAFAISQRNKKWYVLKSTPNALLVLAEGTDENINDPDVVDVMQVDVQGSSFSFRINDELVTQVTDSDYAEGEIGFFVQTFDAAAAHIHFDELTVNNLEVSIACDVKAASLNVRSGPGTQYSSIYFLSRGKTILPIGRDANGSWLLIPADDENPQGWVSNSGSILSCTESVDLLPVTSP